MENMDKTLFTSDEEELQKIYDEEARKLHENDFKLSLLKRLTTEDFPRDLPEDSKKNIEKALLAVSIKDYINLDNGQKLLGLDSFDMSRINLSYMEKRLIRERVEHLLNLEKKKASQAPEPTDEFDKAYEQLVELQKEKIALTETLAELKKQELDLLEAVAEELAGPTQNKIVQGILDSVKIVQLKASGMRNVMLESEENRARYARKAIAEVSEYIDECLQKKDGASGGSKQFSKA